MHFQKFKFSGMGQMFAHVNRDNYTVRKYGNESIESAKTYLNKHLDAGSLERLQKRLSEVSHMKRDDLVVCIGAVVTLPQELCNSDRDTQLRFFEVCKSYLDFRFGKQNCVYATVHYDETTPHLHYGFVPVVTRERKYRAKDKAGQTYKQERICANDVMTKKMLERFHGEFQVFVNEHFGQKVTLVSDTKPVIPKDKTIRQLKQETALDRATAREALEKATTDAQNLMNEAQARVSHMEDEKRKERTLERQKREQAEINSQQAVEARKHAEQEAQRIVEEAKAEADAKRREVYEEERAKALADSQQYLAEVRAKEEEMKAKEKEINLRLRALRESVLTDKEIDDLGKQHFAREIHGKKGIIPGHAIVSNKTLEKIHNIAVDSKYFESHKLDRRVEYLRKADLEEENQRLKAENSYLKEILEHVVDRIWEYIPQMMREYLNDRGIKTTRQKGIELEQERERERQRKLDREQTQGYKRK